MLFLFKYLHGKQGFCSFGISIMCSIFALKFSFKVPTSALPNEVDRESVQQKFGILNGSQHPVRKHQPSLGHVNVFFCNARSLTAFSKNKQKLSGEALWSSSQQNKDTALRQKRKSNLACNKSFIMP